MNGSLNIQYVNVMNNVSKHNLYNDYNRGVRKTTATLPSRGQWHDARVCLRKAILWELKQDSSDK